MKDGIIVKIDKYYFMNYEKAVLRLQEVLVEYKKNKKIPLTNDIYRDSVIQRFEICYELSWKALKEYMTEEGYQVETFPKSILKAAYQNSIIHEEDIWLSMIKDRNVASHEYNEAYIVEVVERVENQYYPQFLRLYEDLK